MAAANTAHVALDLSGLQNLATAAQTRTVTRKAVTKMAAAVRPGVKAEAPRRAGGGGGTLKSAISSKAVKGKKGRTVSYAVVGARTKVRKRVTVRGRGGKPVTVEAVPSKYQHLVALGTRPHALGKGASLVRRGRGGSHIGQGGAAQHPGAKANNFLRRGFEARRAAAAAAGQEVLRTEVPALVAKESRRLLGKLGR